jgi:hypothetical protein
MYGNENNSTHIVNLGYPSSTGPIEKIMKLQG